MAGKGNAGFDQQTLLHGAGDETEEFTSEAAVYRTFERGMNIRGIGLVELARNTGSAEQDRQYQQFAACRFFRVSTGFVFVQHQWQAQMRSPHLQQCGIGNNDERYGEGARVGELHAQIRTDAGRFARSQGQNA